GIQPISFLAPYGFTHPLTRTHVTTLIRVGPRPESIGGPDCSVPHPTRTHRRPPSASLPTISSTL
ncbi:unnamed protein product, partial [Brassica rapa subsp. trilocularis]